MKRSLLLTALLASVGSLAQAASLAEHLPAGALLTLETRNATGALGRLTGMVTRAADSFDEEGQFSEAASGIGQVLNGSLGREAVVGVFTVSQGPGKFSPELLAVSRVDELAGEFFGSMMPKKAGAKVGVYTFSRQGGTFVGQAGGLVYASTNKDLLMAYLGRLSGRTAPRLMNSPAYTTPTRAMGAQEMSLFLNFSATAKVARSYLASMMLPRLLSPIVDAVDTMGQYAAGFTTSQAGLTGQSAHLPNAQGKDRPLLKMLTHSTEFDVQSIIPADVEQVKATACATESGPYLGRWLTRLDLIDPVGFLTDSQLASHLERSAHYLGDECAQVTLAGGMKSGLDRENPLASLEYSVSYQRVRDLDAAKAHMPEYTQSVNDAIKGVAQTLQPLLKQGDLLGMTDSLPGGMRGAGVLGSSVISSNAQDLLKMIEGLKMVYAFRGDYLITAFSDKALQAALAETPDTLGQNAEFQAANLGAGRSAGWTYQPDLPDLTPEDFTALMPDLSGEEDMGDLGLGEVDTSDMSDEERALLDELRAAQGQGSEDQVVTAIFGVASDLLNRYDGMTGQGTVINTPQGDLVVGKSNVKYRW